MDGPTGRQPHLHLVYSCKPSGGGGKENGFSKKAPAAPDRDQAACASASAKKETSGASALIQRAWELVDSQLETVADHRLMDFAKRSNATWRSGCAIYIIGLLEARIARSGSDPASGKAVEDETVSALGDFLEKDLFSKTADQLRLSYFMATQGLGGLKEYENAAAECVEVAEQRVSYLRIKGLIKCASGENAEDALYLLVEAAKEAETEIPDDKWKAQLRSAISEGAIPIARARISELGSLGDFEREIALIDLEGQVSRLVLDCRESASLKEAIEKYRCGE